NLFRIESGFEPAPGARVEQEADAAGLASGARAAQNMAAIGVADAASVASTANMASTVSTGSAHGFADDEPFAPGDGAPSHKQRARLTLAELAAHPLFDGSEETATGE